MRSLLRRLLDALFKHIPFFMSRRLAPRPVIGLFYHSVSDEYLPHQQHIYPPEPVARFEAAMRYIKRHFQPVSYAQVHSQVLDGKPLPPRALHLSFDDGFSQCFDVVRPILIGFDIPCTFFVATDWLDNRSMFYRNQVSLCIERAEELEVGAQAAAWAELNQALGLGLKNRVAFVAWIKSLVRQDQRELDVVLRVLGVDVPAYLTDHQPYLGRDQVRQLHAEGFTIGCHTRSHHKLLRLSPAQQEAEIVESARVVVGITGQDVVPFSFPNSGNGLDRAHLAAIRRHHPLLGLFFDTQGLRPDANYIIQRIWAEQAAYRGAGRRTNLPALLHAAYAAEFWRQLRGR